MDSGTTSLHKVLKDENRQKIISLISSKGSISYTTLLDESEILSTGLLNYHLKVIGDLLEKNNLGEYKLSEKGKMALNLLEESPKKTERATFKPKFWGILAIAQIVPFIVVTVLFFMNLIDLSFFITSAITFLGMLVVVYFGYRLHSMPRTEAIQRTGFVISYILSGAAIGGFFALFGTALISYVTTSMGGPNILRLIGPSHFHVASYCISLTVVGAIVGYFIGKKQSFTQPRWIKWIDKHFPC
jgi:hypothetical protein